MREIGFSSDTPLTLVTTVARGDPWHCDRFLLDVHSPTHDIRLHFTDPFVVAAFRRACTAMLRDARRLRPGEGVAGHLYALNEDSYTSWYLSTTS